MTFLCPAVFFFQAEDGIRDHCVTGVQTCALPIFFADFASQTIVNNVVGLAKSAKIWEIPTLLTVVLERQGGKIIEQLQDVFPEQQPLDRTWINTWRPERHRVGRGDR